MKKKRIRKEQVQQSEWNNKVVGAYQKAFYPVAKILTSLAGLWVIAYVIGWIRADSYYTSLGASWLANELSAQHILSLSDWPIFALLLGIIFTFDDLARMPFGKGMNIMGHIISALALGLILWALYLGIYEKEYANAAALNLASLYSVSSVLGIELGRIAMDLSGKGYKWSTDHIWRLIFYLFWFLITVGSLGSYEGQRDANINQTTLPVIEAKDKQHLRLILEKDGLVYGAILQEKEKPKIRILSHAEIEYIQQAVRNTKFRLESE